MTSTEAHREWWKEALVYQIYPASFLDSNGDGWGDIPGIISKLDYIKSVGANTIWLSPIYASPQRDMGYDVSDYLVNHTSDEHAWFKASRSSNENTKRGWYFWRPPKKSSDGSRRPPNNWKSIFGGSAWHYDEATEEYYLALFLPSQPDLDWTNEDMRQSIHDDIRFWLDRGVDGFRIDSMNLMSKYPDLPDAEITDPNEEYQSGDKWFASGPRMHEYLRELRTKVFDPYKAITVGELGFTKDVDSVSKYVSRSRHEINMLFTGDIVDLDFGATKFERDDFHPKNLRAVTEKWQTAMPKFDGWNTVYLDNHDSGRSLTRYASDAPEYRTHAAKLLAVYLTTLSGTLFLLAGQEIGMANLPKSMGIEHYLDVEGRNYYHKVLESRGGDVSKMENVMREMQLKARDHGRLPVQWSAATNAGFTELQAKPWMTINPDYKEWNVESQLDDPNSVLSFWKKSLAARMNRVDLFVYGTFESVPEAVPHDRVIAYKRTSPENGHEALVMLNFSDEANERSLPRERNWDVLRGNYPSVRRNGDDVVLRPWEAVVFLAES
ncbi:hypothetical protein H2200_002960 [Cladophialophora chaetospira]|uniref:Glycosyl hydrolase family 13 catalytic domain-containing protein n=1 Tax=Cladophialophora chaetospira TaxID=386627 RepID=A0AA38XGI8_9EURO|nr:hypothetical protein H2200_002960 [Cladophialophora chaetospira]